MTIQVVRLKQEEPQTNNSNRTKIKLRTLQVRYLHEVNLEKNG
jgi:hypothetical protein